ncbi:MAG: DUF1294 domain-containing protein [Clostridiales bacterium]|nr:DUF1294 domain-containing protein [Clostridiales bacterium]
MHRALFILVASYLIMINLIGFISMGIDKRRAIHDQWRIPERRLLIIAFLGGGVGTLLGMSAFRHKTKHIKFVLLVPLASFLYAILCFYLFKNIL